MRTMYNIRTQLRMFRPVAEKEQEVQRVVKVFPYLLPSPDPNCFPPKSRKITNVRRRIKDRISKDVAGLLAPDLQSQESEEDFRYQITKHLERNRVDCQKKQAMSASPSMKFVFGPVDDPDAPLHADTTLGSDMQLWNCTRRRSASSNDSSNIKSVMHLNEDYEQPEPTRRQKGNYVDKRYTCSTFGIVDDDKFVWLPSYRLAGKLLATKGIHDSRSEYNSMQTHQQKQEKMLSYKNSHWRSTLFTAPENEDRPPYKFNDIIAGEPSPDPMALPRSVARFRPWRYRNIESPINGLSVFHVANTSTKKPEAADQRIEEGRLHHWPHFTPLRYKNVVDPITGCVLFNAEKKEDCASLMSDVSQV